MCLVTEQKRAFIAKEDIQIFKQLDNDRMSIYSNTKIIYEKGILYKTRIKLVKDVFSPFDMMVANYYKKHEKNYESTLIKTNFPTLRIFGSGFHATTSSNRITAGHYIMFKGIIPKGSRYYLDATGLCISNQIIIF